MQSLKKQFRKLLNKELQSRANNKTTHVEREVSDAQFSPKIIKTCKETKKYSPFTGKLTQIVQEEEKTQDLLDKDFKLTI